jgi:hypothetical protein
MKLRFVADSFDKGFNHQPDDGSKLEGIASINELLLKHLCKTRSHSRLFKHVLSMSHHGKFNGTS